VREERAPTSGPNASVTERKDATTWLRFWLGQPMSGARGKGKRERETLGRATAWAAMSWSGRHGQHGCWAVRRERSKPLHGKERGQTRANRGPEGKGLLIFSKLFS